MTTPTTPGDIRKTNVTLSQRDRRKFRRIMLDLEEIHDFPIELKESHCLNAAVQLIIRASDDSLIEEQARRMELDDSETQGLHEEYKWFMGQFVEILRDIVDERVNADKRRREPNS